MTQAFNCQQLLNVVVVHMTIKSRLLNLIMHNEIKLKNGEN